MAKKDNQTVNTSLNDLVLKIFEKCVGKSGCEVCRPNMEEDCLSFPELYRLNDELIEQEKFVDNKTICQLLDLCTFVSVS